MLRFGKISEIDAVKGLARVHFEEDDIVSGWLKVSIPNSSKIKDETWFDVNEPVWCMMDENAEQGVIGGSYYDSNSTPTVGNKDIRRTTYEDGTYVEYNRSTHEFTIKSAGNVTIICKNATITAEQTVTIDCPSSTFTGDVEIQGLLQGTGGLFSGTIKAQGDIKAGLEVVARNGVPGMSVKLSTHNHPTAAPGAPSPPTPNT